MLTGRLAGQSAGAYRADTAAQETTVTVSRHSKVGGPCGSPVNDDVHRSSAAPAASARAIAVTVSPRPLRSTRTTRGSSDSTAVHA